MLQNRYIIDENIHKM